MSLQPAALEGMLLTSQCWALRARNNLPPCRGVTVTLEEWLLCCSALYCICLGEKKPSHLQVHLEKRERQLGLE